MPQFSDPGIPTLTQRVEPTVPPIQPDTGAPAKTQHDDLPVLTDRAEPSPRTASRPPWEDDVPVLTDVAAVSDASDASGRSKDAAHGNTGPGDAAMSDAESATLSASPATRATAIDSAPGAAGGAGLPQAAFSTAATHAGADMAVLRIALQAEFEQALQQALDEAAATVRARLEADLPAMIERAMSKVRPG